MLRYLFKNAKSHLDAKLMDLQRAAIAKSAAIHQQVSTMVSGIGAEPRLAFTNSGHGVHDHPRMEQSPVISARDSTTSFHNGPVNPLEGLENERRFQITQSIIKRDQCKNPMLVSLLDQQGDTSDSGGSTQSDHQQSNASSMLSALLGDGDVFNSNDSSPLSGSMASSLGGAARNNSSLNLHTIPPKTIPIAISNTLSNVLTNAKPRKPRKRRIVSDNNDMRTTAMMMAGRNAKRKSSQGNPLQPSPSHGLPHGLEASLYDKISPPSGGGMLQQHHNSFMHQANAMHHNVHAKSYGDNRFMDESLTASRLSSTLESMVKQEKLNQMFSSGDVFRNSPEKITDKVRSTSESSSKTTMLAELLEDTGDINTNSSLLQCGQRDSASFLANKSPSAAITPSKNKATLNRLSNNEFKPPQNITTESGIIPTDTTSLPNRTSTVMHHPISGGNISPTPIGINRHTQSPQLVSTNTGLGDLLDHNSGGMQQQSVSSSAKTNSVPSYIHASVVPDIKPSSKNSNSLQLSIKKDSPKSNPMSAGLEGKNSPIVNRINSLEDCRSSPISDKGSKKKASPTTPNSVNKVSVQSPVREKPIGITMKLNTKDNTAKTYVKSLSDNSSTKFNSKFSSASSSKSGKVVKGDPEKTYAFVSDDILPVTMKSMSSANSTSSLKMKKYKSEEHIGLEKNQHLSLSGDGKRKRDESKKEKGLKKRKIRSGHNSVYGEHLIDSNRCVEKLSPTTLKITKRSPHSNSKSYLSTHSNSSTSRSSSKSPSNIPINISSVSSTPTTTSSTSLSISKTHTSKSQLSSSQLKSNKLLLKTSKVNRSKSEPDTNVLQLSGSTVSEKIGEKKSDQKLKSNPTIKLKPVLMPVSTSVATMPTTPTSTVISKSDSTSTVGDTGTTISSKNKPAPTNARRSSLTAIVDKLKKQQSTPPEMASLPDKKKLERLARKDPVAHKNEMDNIRHKILMAGTNAGAPGKDVVGSLKSFRKTSVLDPRKTDMTTKSVLGSKPPPTTTSQYRSIRPGYSIPKPAISGPKTTTSISTSSSVPNSSQNSMSSTHNQHVHGSHTDSLPMQNKIMPSKSGLYGNMSGRQTANNVHGNMNNMHCGTGSKQINTTVQRGSHTASSNNSASRKMLKPDESGMTRHFLDAVGNRIADPDQSGGKQQMDSQGGDGGRTNGDCRTSDMRGRGGCVYVNNKNSSNNTVGSRTSGCGVSDVNNSKAQLHNKENARIQVTENKPTEIRTHAPKPRGQSYDSNRTFPQKHGSVTLMTPMSPDSTPSSPENGLVIDVPGADKDHPKNSQTLSASLARLPTNKVHKPPPSSHIVYSSPISSPVAINSPVSDPDSPIVAVVPMSGGGLDDNDLMDAAIML